MFYFFDRLQKNLNKHPVNRTFTEIDSFETSLVSLLCVCSNSKQTSQLMLCVIAGSTFVIMYFNMYIARVKKSVFILKKISSSLLLLPYFEWVRFQLFYSYEISRLGIGMNCFTCHITLTFYLILPLKKFSSHHQNETEKKTSCQTEIDASIQSFFEQIIYGK